MSRGQAAASMESCRITDLLNGTVDPQVRLSQYDTVPDIQQSVILPEHPANLPTLDSEDYELSCHSVVFDCKKPPLEGSTLPDNTVTSPPVRGMCN